LSTLAGIFNLVGQVNEKSVELAQFEVHRPQDLTLVPILVLKPNRVDVTPVADEVKGSMGHRIPNSRYEGPEVNWDDP